jgi:hypothetical protein
LSLMERGLWCIDIVRIRPVRRGGREQQRRKSESHVSRRQGRRAVNSSELTQGEGQSPDRLNIRWEMKIYHI